MIANKINYAYSLILHSIIILLSIYLLKPYQPKEVYNEIININLLSIKSQKSNLEENIKNKVSKKKVVPIKKNIEKKKIPISKKNKKTINSFSTNKNKVPEDLEKEIEKSKENTYQPVINENKKSLSEKEIEDFKNFKKDKVLKEEKITNTEIEIFNRYNMNLKYLIQKKATENYPRSSIRKNEQGSVELIFSIDMDGKIYNIQIGPNTNASKRLINSSIKTLNLISPYEKNKILKKKNTFSIIIIYKLK